MDLSAAIQSYLILHGVTTVGAIVIFLVRNEHRITKLETRLDYHEKSPHASAVNPAIQGKPD